MIRLGNLDLLKKEEVFELLESIGEMLSATLGDWCEEPVHDVSGDVEHSIVAITGDVTGRSVGGHVTDLGLAVLRVG
jgi:predicted transcriptional regulator YheO